MKFLALSACEMNQTFDPSPTWRALPKARSCILARPIINMIFGRSSAELRKLNGNLHVSWYDANRITLGRI
jgi:uncharacterized protein YfaA (DUF2138 family)